MTELLLYGSDPVALVHDVADVMPEAMWGDTIDLGMVGDFLDHIGQRARGHAALTRVVALSCLESHGHEQRPRTATGFGVGASPSSFRSTRYMQMSRSYLSTTHLSLSARGWREGQIDRVNLASKRTP